MNTWRESLFSQTLPFGEKINQTSVIKRHSEHLFRHKTKRGEQHMCQTESVCPQKVVPIPNRARFIHALKSCPDIKLL